MPRLSPTLRTVAARLHLSVATVSEALRDSPRVQPTTRERVKAEARRQGYIANPFLGGVLSAVRQSRHQQYRGSLALIDVDDGNPDQYALFHRAIVSGAQARARDLGFLTEFFWMGDQAPALPVSRLPGVLHARGITGAVLLPFNQRQDLGDFNFAGLAAVQMDHSVLRPRLHTILPDHYVSMTNAVERLTARGYRRIGLCLEARKDNRIMGKWSASFQAAVHRTGHALDCAVQVQPVLDCAAFVAWAREFQPDVVLGHEESIPRWLEGIGRQVPRDVGFFNLNTTEATRPCAGLDLAPTRLGAVAVETVVGMLHRHECGVPAHPQSVALEALWVEGPTLRPPAE